MAIPFLNHLDLRSVSELQNAILHKTTSGSASDIEGKIIYDTGTDTIKYYSGSSGSGSWISLTGDTNTFRTVKVDTNNDGSANATLGATENLQLIGGTNITLAESAGVVTINAGASTTVGLTNSTQRSGSIELIAGTNVAISESGTTGHYTFSSTDTNTQNTTTLSFVDSSNDVILRNTTGGAGSGNQDIKMVAGSNITLTHTDANTMSIASTDTNTQLSTSDVRGKFSAGEGIDISSGEISGEDASTSNKGIVELATTAETTTGTDTVKAVTPDGLKDGYQGSTNVATLGTITTGTWNGTAIDKTYLDLSLIHI